MGQRLIVLSGIPGSGKSKYAESLLIEYGDKVVIVSSDEIRKELTGKYASFGKESAVWKTLENRVDEASERSKAIVVIDATSLKNKKRYYYAKKFRNKFKSVELVVFRIPFFECLKRNKMRPEEKRVPEDVIHNMFLSQDPIETDTVFNYFDKVFEIDDVRMKELQK